MIEPSKLQLMKRFVPKRVKRAAKDAMLDRTFRRAVAGISKLAPGEGPSRQLLNDLIVSWGNEGFAARLDYLEEVARQAASVSGPILECGSGLTTVLMGLLAGRRGVETWSLEHFPDWRTRVMSTVARFQIPNVHICLSPLREYGEFDWYFAPLEQMPGEFDLVICDGPPGNTKGGRYGLWPVIGDRLSSRAVILLDDADRPGEAEVLQRWATQANLKIASASDGTFAVITRA